MFVTTLHSLLIVWLLLDILDSHHTTCFKETNRICGGKRGFTAVHWVSVWSIFTFCGKYCAIHVYMDVYTVKCRNTWWKHKSASWISNSNAHRLWKHNITCMSDTDHLNFVLFEFFHIWISSSQRYVFLSVN